MDINLQITLFDMQWDSDCSSWIQVFNVDTGKRCFNLFYLERQPDTGLSWLEILGFRIV